MLVLQLEYYFQTKFSSVANHGKVKLVTVVRLHDIKICLTNTRLRLSCVGLLDIVEYENGANNSATVARHQQDDLLSLGRILLALACNSSLVAIQRENVQKALETVAMNYSSDVKNLILCVDY